ncbi:hypothetical protein GCM10017600_16300 [Streptosporangium carneum]|uniref:Uncharacterized protein n=1 Tax=Streptosporangium carneum TaxID=47481 RepID=A0A9W6HZJ1_9ACTN|nr:hypothetical protein GCM10017600_16300 [Streptosporangium carneum]
MRTLEYADVAGDHQSASLPDQGQSALIGDAQHLVSRAELGPYTCPDVTLEPTAIHHKPYNNISPPKNSL